MQTGGKHSVEMFRNFFTHFEVETFVIVDSDALADGYNKLCLPPELAQKCGNIQEVLDAYDPAVNLDGPTSKQASNYFNQYSWAEKYNKLMAVSESMREGNALTDDDHFFLQSLSKEKIILKKRAAIIDPDYEQEKLDALFHQLRQAGVAILSRGAVEAYFPPGEISGNGKPERALAAVELARGIETLNLPKTTIDGEQKCELSAIFSHFFTR